MRFASNFILLVLLTFSYFQDLKCLHMKERSKYRRVTCSTLNDRIFIFFRLKDLKNYFSFFKNFALHIILHLNLTNKNKRI